MRQALRRCVTPADEGRIMNQRVNPPQIRRDRGSTQTLGQGVEGLAEEAWRCQPCRGRWTGQLQPLPPTRIGSQRRPRSPGSKVFKSKSVDRKRQVIAKSLKWFRKVSLASRSVQECSFFYRQSALGSKRCPLPTTYLPTASLQAACLSISVTSSSTSLPISEGSSPSAITLISGSVPDGRTSNRPPFWSSRDFASAIA
jgi:hypothetical protein